MQPNVPREIWSGSQAKGSPVPGSNCPRKCAPQGLTAPTNFPWAVLVALDESHVLAWISAVSRAVWFQERGLYTKHRSSLWGRELDEWVSYQIFVVTLNIAILLTLAVSGRQVQNELIKIVHILQSSPLLQQHQKKKMLNTSQKSTAVPKKRSLSIWGGIKGLAHVCSTRSD